MKRNFFLKIIAVTSILILTINIIQCSIKTKSKIEKIDELMNYCYKNKIFNGTILVAENEKVIYKKAFGVSNFKTNDLLQTHSVFYLASVSKQFTTMAIMILAEKGTLSYEDRLSKFFPEFPSYADQVKIRHLMNHTSGIPDHFTLGASKPDLTNEEVLRLLVKQNSLDFQPGEKFKYSNGGYVLLAMIVEKASGIPFHEFLKNNIFNSLGMNDSLVFDQSKPQVKRRAVGYNMFGDVDDYNILTVGAGGIFSTIEDLFKWDQALYTEKLIKQSTLKDAFSPCVLNNGKKSNYGFGWGIQERRKGKIVGHGGGLAGFRTYIERQLKKKNTIILLSNNGNDQLPLIRKAIANILKNRVYDLPKISIACSIHDTINKVGINAAIQQYYDLKEKKSNWSRYNFAEYELNRLGYHLLEKNKFNEAVEIFKLNVKEYPKSWVVYDSLGEACMKSGNTKHAIKNYKKSIQLNPKNKAGIKALKKLKLLEKNQASE